jgi:hypothetical protein
MRRFAGMLVVLWATLPIYSDLTRARLFKAYMLSGRARRVGALAAATALIAVFSLFRHYWFALATAALVFPVPLGRLRQWVGRRRGLRHLDSLPWPLSPVPAAADTLGKMGLDPARVSRLVAAASREIEVVIATFDQENRVASEVGPIPLFEGWHVSQVEFTPRRTHLLQLVIYNGAVAIKKTYRDRVRLYNEAMALHALAGVEGVPRIVSLRSGDRVLYQTFLPGENVGSVMARRGAAVILQHRVDVGYPGSRNWDAAGTPRPERAESLEALRAVMDETAVDALGRLLVDVQRAGVVIRDVKYGNVIMLDGKPYLCDFDGARVYPRNSLRFLLERESERDKFNYVFGGHLYCETAFWEEMRELGGENPNLPHASVYYGYGYRVGTRASLAGAAEWRAMRRHLPSLRDKVVLDLGTTSVIRPLEMLRAGARRVTALVPDPVLAGRVGASRRWLELLDNRSYDLEIVAASTHELCERHLATCQVATAFCSLYLEPPEEMARITRELSHSVEYFVVQGNEDLDGHSPEIQRRASLPFLRTLLAENGFPHQRVARIRFSDRPLVIARSSRVADRDDPSS